MTHKTLAPASWSVAAILLLALTVPAYANNADTLSAEVVAVTDGNTISIVRDGEDVEIRLQGIDAPEEGQAFYEVARNGLAHAVLGKTVTIQMTGRDLEKHLTGRVYLGEIDINLELVKAGLAWHNRPESSDKALMEAQKAARKAKKGIWQQRLRPTPPWKYRLAESRPEEREVDQRGYSTPPGGRR